MFMMEVQLTGTAGKVWETSEYTNCRSDRVDKTSILTTIE